MGDSQSQLGGIYGDVHPDRLGEPSWTCEDVGYSGWHHCCIAVFDRVLADLWEAPEAMAGKNDFQEVLMVCKR